MTRSTAREIAVHLVFELEFQDHDASLLLAERLQPEFFSRLKEEEELDLYSERPSGKQMDYIRNVVTGVQEKWLEINAHIEKYAVGWNLSRISRLAKAAMRVAIFECLYVEDVPTGVAINEAIRILKDYEDEDVTGFANGILGSFAREAAK
ncbi:MAG: transcription antitermination factor NusB [Ruminococcaceae bacterium]|nr:transcription antitermination factor NusB [Oscillospiraceae bacterium]